MNSKNILSNNNNKRNFEKISFRKYTFSTLFLLLVIGVLTTWAKGDGSKRGNTGMKMGGDSKHMEMCTKNLSEVVFSSLEIMDANKDEKIDKNEYQTYVVENVLNKRMNDAMELQKEIFSFFDSNNNGEIEKKEAEVKRESFRKSLNEWEENNMDHLFTNIREMDANNDEIISKVEYQGYMSKVMGMRIVNAQKLQFEIFSFFDVNQNGEIDEKEVKADIDSFRKDS